MNKYSFYPFITVVSIVIVLTILTFFYREGGSLLFKKIDLFADIRYKQATIVTPPKTNSFKSAEELTTQSRNTPIATENAEGNIPHLPLFFSKLKLALTKGKKIRIAYFGDSMIEGDLITQDIRDALQKKFGGSGVGFVPITSPVAGFRQSIIHSFSDNWLNYNFLKRDSSSTHKPGMSGYVFLPQLTTQSGAFSWVKYKASNFRTRWASFKNCNLYYGKSSSTNFCFIEKDAQLEKVALNGTDFLNIQPISTSNYASSIKLNFNITDPLPIYGVSFESDSGIVLDNFSFRGNSGLTLTSIPYKYMQLLASKMNYDLIILHYGLNVANTTMKDYTWYEKGMERVITYLKSCFPQSEILLVSVSDKSYKNDAGVFETDPAIPLLVKAQARAAQTTNSAFYNLYNAMGGYNSMVKWVQADTALANKDYTHVNFAGSKKIANYITQFLLQGVKAPLNLPNGETSNKSTVAKK